MSNSAQWNNSRRVIERVFISGTLKLETPASFGAGDAEGWTDMDLLYDALDGHTPLLTGASIAGALRNYLREYEHGFAWAEKADGGSRAEKLFGHLDDSDEKRRASVLSWLMVDDACGKRPEAGRPIEIREGVAIDPKTRTAEEQKLFSIELLAAGTTFDLHFELWLSEGTKDNLESLAIALQGLEGGEIGLGRRKRRGYGRCRVTGWKVQRYAMAEKEGVLGWLNHTRGEGQPYEHIVTILEKAPALASQRESFQMAADFRLQTSLLIRSDSGDVDGVDRVHLHSRREGEDRPILSGTSLAGALRARALRIANTVFRDEEQATSFVDGMFGRRIQGHTDAPTGSRVIVHETVIDDPVPARVQNRVKLDRFTGGAYPGALFSQQPLFAKSQSPTCVHVLLELRKPHEAKEEDFHAEIGLLLLVLKDLWTGDLALGGESSVGRGRLRGESATLRLGEMVWVLSQSEEGGLSFSGSGKPGQLQNQFLQRFLEKAQ